jgi:hypothetical protein
MSEIKTSAKHVVIFDRRPSDGGSIPPASTKVLQSKNLVPRACRGAFFSLHSICKKRSRQTMDSSSRVRLPSSNNVLRLHPSLCRP